MTEPVLLAEVWLPPVVELAERVVVPVDLDEVCGE